ncbi:MAG: GYDIA family GHMP kinase [Bacteroidota bacterium]
MTKIFRASGKLLLSSEYLVLSGASALAVPLKRGQLLKVQAVADPEKLQWKALYKGESWFEASFNRATWELHETSDRKAADMLTRIFHALSDLAPGFKDHLGSADVLTELDFDPSWGFGSSSTLTALMASWAGVNPLDLHFRISSGSGYDVACAMSDGPLVYRLNGGIPEIQRVAFSPSFAGQLWFVWLGKKQRSEESIQHFHTLPAPGPALLETFSKITGRMLEASGLPEFGQLLHRHEQLLGDLLCAPTLRESVFYDLDGWSKSLGAWGGDFALLATPVPGDELKNYLRNKGFDVVFNFKELVKDE